LPNNTYTMSLLPKCHVTFLRRRKSTITERNKLKHKAKSVERMSTVSTSNSFEYQPVSILKKSGVESLPTSMYLSNDRPKSISIELEKEMNNHSEVQQHNLNYDDVSDTG
jgi:hypothetical protein